MRSISNSDAEFIVRAARTLKQRVHTDDIRTINTIRLLTRLAHKLARKAHN